MRQTTLYFGLGLTLFTSCSENKTSKQNTITNNPDSLAGKSKYANPVDGKTYSTNGEFKKYSPEGNNKSAIGPVQLLNVVLLTDQSKIQQIINVDKLADFIKGVDKVVIKELLGEKDSGQIILQFTLYSDKKPNINLSYKGNLNTGNLNELSTKVGEFSLDTRTLKDSCIFQSVYGVNEKHN